MNEGLKLALSGDVVALPVLATVVGSILRHNPGVSLEVCVWTRAGLPADFTAGRLRVEFREASEKWGAGGGRFPVEMFDKFEVVTAKPEWSRCLMWGWDMVCKGDLSELWESHVAGKCGAFVDGRRGKRRGSWEWDDRLPRESGGGMLSALVV